MSEPGAEVKSVRALAALPARRARAALDLRECQPHCASRRRSSAGKRVVAPLSPEWHDRCI